ncbi:PucR family transcriptional regulator [Kineococcus radiotolerans]|uniref:Transcriptional regulator, PucR family n=1 Tax=Kineococcus radiotolerans (strain ATCC BAA-149 / DSM 14245 / SRS30216) TaxID=266940 RepID=A6W7X2_KINRD|nr:PucR family transcriptional regulator [Kineococcus radiotolerans]ABS02911.1 transcriptional regulator, PucR family [Kineococcus radiotolerans SRS30216 = ATCC BAA-149]
MVVLADLLTTRSLDLRLLGGDPSVPVRWVATSELDDPTAFLEGGELLLTTGLRTPRAGWAGWAERLRAAGVSGVGFGTGLSHRAVPRTLVGAAAAQGLALVEVPVPTPFIAVSRRLADLLRRGENDAEAAAARTQRDLAVDAAGPDGVGAVLRRVARSAGGPAWLLDPGGAVRAATTAAPPPPEAVAGLHRVRDQGVRAAWRDVSPQRSLLLRATGSAGSGWLLVACAPATPRAVSGTVGTAAALLGLLTARAAAPAGLAEATLALLLEGRADLAARLAEAAGAPLPDPLVVVRWTGSPPGTAWHDDRHAVLAPGDVGDPPPGARWGVSGTLPAARAAEGVRPAGAAHTRTGPHRALARAGTGALAEVLDPGAVRPWSRRRLAPLAAVEDGAVLRASARAFLEHHGARQPTADALGVHRNTVRHRVARLEALLGISLDSAADRAELWLALTADEAG